MPSVMKNAQDRGICKHSELMNAERCKLPAYWDSASPIWLTSYIPTAIYGGSCGNVCSRYYTFILPWVPGGVAQLGERLNGIQEVRGSIPLASTGLAETCDCFVEPARRVVAECSAGESGAGMTCGNSSVGRAQPCQGWGRGFESRFPLCVVCWCGRME